MRYADEFTCEHLANSRILRGDNLLSCWVSASFQRGFLQRLGQRVDQHPSGC